jgi:hypothetical protein
MRPAALIGGAARWLARLRVDRRGGVAIIAALALPALLVLGAGATEIAFLATDKSKLQEVSDAAALLGARELSVSDEGVVVRTEAFALEQAKGVARNATVTAKAELLADNAGVKVTMSGHRMSFFGNLLPPGGFHFSTSATAMAMNIVPLCVLAHGEKKGEVLRLKNKATLEAVGCLVHANDSMNARDQSRLVASVNQAVKSAKGAIVDTPQTDAPVTPDPYAGRSFNPPGMCLLRKQVFIEKNTTLQPGVHCDDINVIGTAILTLAAGEHYFVRSRLVVEDNARLEGSNVALVFDHAAFDFMENARVSLSGRKSGNLAGFLVVGVKPKGGTWCGKGGDKDNDNHKPKKDKAKGKDDDDDDDDDDEGGGLISGVIQGVGGTVDTLLNEGDRSQECTLAIGSEFVLASDNVEALDGVIYVPSSKLTIVGTQPIAEGSDWTVMVAERIEVKGSPRLVINSDYDSSTIPVPPGVGPTRGEARLVQ